MWLTHNAGRCMMIHRSNQGESLWILDMPQATRSQTLGPWPLIKHILKNYHEIGTQRTMIVAILGAYKILNLKLKEKGSYEMYLKEYEKLDGVLRDRAKDNVPTYRQRAGFVSYPELQRVRKRLPVGSKERLLLSCYGGCIPPLRNDLHACAIRKLECDDESARQALLQQITPNEILLPYDRNAPGVLILREFKTQNRENPKLYSRSLGMNLSHFLSLTTIPSVSPPSAAHLIKTAQHNCCINSNTVTLLALKNNHNSFLWDCWCQRFWRQSEHDVWLSRVSSCGPFHADPHAIDARINEEIFQALVYVYLVGNIKHHKSH